MKKSKQKKLYKLTIYFIALILVLILLILTIRQLTTRQLDDVSPLIPCEKSLIDKSDILFVIPKYQNFSIAENKSWCKEIQALNKTLAMHGIYHTYYELNKTKSLEYIQEGREIFKACFGYYPKIFKPSQMGINKENSILITQSRMELISPFNQIMHKAYHCNDTGMYSNKIMDWV